MSRKPHRNIYFVVNSRHYPFDIQYIRGIGRTWPAYFTIRRVSFWSGLVGGLIPPSVNEFTKLRMIATRYLSGVQLELVLLLLNSCSDLLPMLHDLQINLTMHDCIAICILIVNVWMYNDSSFTSLSLIMVVRH